jgi:N-acetylglucosaminyldiphosphoundecaprenol N-acetyl-beta-D-mannosaminyltransferase
MTDRPITILGTHVSQSNRKSIKRFGRELLFSPKSFSYVVTPNAEICLRASKDEDYRNILNSATLSIADSIGLFWGGLILGNIPHARVTGVDLLQYYLDLLAEPGADIVVVLKKGGLMDREAVVSFFETRYPSITPHVVYTTEAIAQKITQVQPRLVVITAGVPTQEQIAYQLKREIRDVQTVAICVGGALDFLSGVQERAPAFLRIIGLEWLYRLYKQPHRIGRIFNATFVFISRIIYWKIRSMLQYRPNVVIAVVDENKQILTIHLKRFREWGLAQGGVDPGESIKQAAFREAFEELGLTAEELEYLGEARGVYQYDWPFWDRINRGFKGQKQSVAYLQYTGPKHAIRVDGREANEFKWVDLVDLVDNVGFVRKPIATEVVRNFPKKR